MRFIFVLRIINNNKLDLWERAINLNQQLNYIEQLFSSGQIKKAQKDLRKLNTQFGRDKPIPSKFNIDFKD